jgi:hypothetical protein
MGSVDFSHVQLGRDTSKQRERWSRDDLQAITGSPYSLAMSNRGTLLDNLPDPAEHGCGSQKDYVAASKPSSAACNELPPPMQHSVTHADCAVAGEHAMQP